MSPPDKKQVQAAIGDFLHQQYHKKAEPILKRLEKAQADSELDIQSREELETFRQKYLAENWIADAAQRMASQLNFGTHISKGIHSSSKGSSVIFKSSQQLPSGIFGSQSINSFLIDATGNAAALPLAGFFNHPLPDSPLKIRDVITQYPEQIREQLSSDPQSSERYFQIFAAKLDPQLDQPINDELNKQLLWPLNSESHDEYVCITPLHPSVLTYELYQRATELRYSDANKQARDNSFKKTAEHTSYVSLKDLAFIKLGGTKPQTVGQLNNQQGGRNLLLPSLPPHFDHKGFRISPDVSSVFGKNLIYLGRKPLNQLYAVIQSNQNTAAEREALREALSELIDEILMFASGVKHHQPAGWSLDCALHMSEKLWLDPGRADLPDQEAFALDRVKTNWLADLPKRFALELQDHFKSKFSHRQADFALSELIEWQTQFEQAIKKDKRLSMGVFS